MLYRLAGQFIFVLLGSAANTRLLAFGHSLGSLTINSLSFKPSMPMKSLFLSMIGRREYATSVGAQQKNR